LAPAIRPARKADLPEILTLCAEHAAFERGSFSPEAAGAPLGRLLFGEKRRAWCLVAETEDVLAGYATYALEFSTWRAAEYVHMDCLYVREAFRNAGLGLLLLRAVAEAAVTLGCEVIEWQTPSWNQAAVRFYDRAGAAGSPKVRYALRPGVQRGGPTGPTAAPG
jgi:L-amino acid N-acyltransferase YncA